MDKKKILLPWRKRGQRLLDAKNNKRCLCDEGFRIFCCTGTLFYENGDCERNVHCFTGIL